MTSDDKDVIVDFIAYTSAGASEIAGLAPTLVAAVTSGFAVLREVTNWVPPTIAYISAMILILIIIVKMLSGVTYYAIADKGIELVKKGRLFLEKGITLNRQEISSKVIYLINGALIVLAVSVYMTHPTLGP